MRTGHSTRNWVLRIYERSCRSTWRSLRCNTADDRRSTASEPGGPLQRSFWQQRSSFPPHLHSRTTVRFRRRQATLCRKTRRQRFRAFWSRSTRVLRSRRKHPPLEVVPARTDRRRGQIPFKAAARARSRRLRARARPAVRVQSYQGPRPPMLAPPIAVLPLRPAI
jgi:hypothetical protein